MGFKLSLLSELVRVNRSWQSILLLTFQVRCLCVWTCNFGSLSKDLEPSSYFLLFIVSTMALRYSPSFILNFNDCPSGGCGHGHDDAFDHFECFSKQVNENRRVSRGGSFFSFRSRQLRLRQERIVLSGVEEVK